MFRKFLTMIALMIPLIYVNGCADASEPRLVPPNMIGLLLTPTGFDGKIYEPGQVEIGNTGWTAAWGNQLVLMEKAGFFIKEQFTGPEANSDREDHRCIVGPKREPMTLDVRLLFAMPDYKTEAGKQAILRMGLLGKFTPGDRNLYGGDRVLVLDARTVYLEQVQQQVRGKIRDVCIGYGSVDGVFKAVEKDGTPEGFTDKLKLAIGTVLAENHSPLLLVGAVASNVKPDPLVVKAITENQAAGILVEAMTKIDDFIKADPTGVRGQIYRMMVLQAMMAKGGNTVFMTDIAGQMGLQVVPAK